MFYYKRIDEKGNVVGIASGSVAITDKSFMAITKSEYQTLEANIKAALPFASATTTDKLAILAKHVGLA
ncbi:MAG: hypothetical protein PHQ43_00215 [Dehalococcoidales bacterium]|nr:hypothetical protein [Dehalococcoidales bacterium]